MKDLSNDMEKKESGRRKIDGIQDNTPRQNQSTRLNLDVIRDGFKCKFCFNKKAFSKHKGIQCTKCKKYVKNE